MSAVGIVELLAWVASIALAGWMVLDMMQVARHHDETALINAVDPLDGPDEQPAPTGVSANERSES